MANKPRAKMFSVSENSAIKEFMAVHLDTVRSSHKMGPDGTKKVNKLWAQLTSNVNACGIAPRTVTQVKVRWRYMASFLSNKYNPIMNID